jgi:hypothetical protein
MAQTGTCVTLLNKEHVAVVEGFLSTLKTRDVLHTHNLQEGEVGVYVTNMLNKNFLVSEPVLDCLEECVNTCIRWKHVYVVYKG